MKVQQPLISLTSTTQSAPSTVASQHSIDGAATPSSALEELEIGLNVFNELDDADFSRYSSSTGEKYRSSSSETGRPAATPLRRGALHQFLNTFPFFNKCSIRASVFCSPQRDLNA